MKSEIKRKANRQRFVTIDIVRGLGVLLMIIFHLAFDLDGFRFVNIDFLENPFWYALPRFIVFLFFICVGMSLALVHKEKIKWHLVRKRFYKIGGWALLITLVTFILFPGKFIFFGVLHCIAVTSVVGVLFVSRPRLSLLLCLILVSSDLVFEPELLPLSDWFGVTPMDYVRFYPWIGIVLLGIYLESVNLHKIPINMGGVERPLAAMGRHSLEIYILHRPIIFGAIFFLYKMKNAP
jgi:uncharacterized membrane protein